MNTFTVLCVYDMKLILLKSNGKMLMNGLSEQLRRCCSCPHLVRWQTLKSLRVSRVLQSVCSKQTRVIKRANCSVHFRIALADVQH